MTTRKRPADPLRDIPNYLSVLHTYVGARMYLIFALTLVAAIADSFGILMLIPVLQSVGALEGTAPEGVVGFFSDVLSRLGLGDSVSAVVLFMVGFFLVKASFLFLSQAYWGYLNAQLISELKSRLHDHYRRMRLAYYMSRDTGHFINVINNQTQRFQNFFEQMVSLGIAVSKTTVYFLIALSVAWKFAVMAIVVGLVVFLLFRGLNIYVRTISRETQKEVGNLTKLLIQNVQSLKYLISTGHDRHARKAVIDSIQRIRWFDVRTGMALALTRSVREPIIIISLATLILTQVVILDQSLAPMLVSILLFYRGLNEALGIQARWQALLAFAGSMEMVRDEFARQVQNQEADGTHDLGPLDRSIELKGVHFAYDAQKPSVLRGITLAVPARTTIALVGASGAGKSTLVDILTLMHKPTRGKILIDGISGEEIRLETWRRQIGYVSQETVVFDDTIANNICLWEGDIENNPHLFARVQEAAQQAHLSQVIDSLPSGYQTLVGDRGVRLSGGQRQRLFIARELFKRPNLLILDEATSALDSESESEIRRGIDSLRGRMTVVIVAHRLATIRNADRVFVLSDGQIIESGGYTELRDDPTSHFARLVAAQTL